MLRQLRNAAIEHRATAGSRRKRGRASAMCVALLSVLLLSGTMLVSARAATWSVEKDGSGDFTIIQDALDAAAPGDSILIGPGRFDNFRVQDFPGIGSIALPMAIRTGPLTIIGSGPGNTFVGPNHLVTEALGLPTYGLQQELAGPEFELEGVTIENVGRAVGLEGSASFRNCVIRYCPDILVLLGPQLIPTLGFDDCSFVGRPPGGNPNAARPAGIVTAVGGFTPDLHVTNCNFEETVCGIQAYGCVSCIIDGCTFDDIFLGIELRGGTTEVRNCTVLNPINGSLALADGAHADVADCYFEAGYYSMNLFDTTSLTGTRSFFGGGTLFTIKTANGVMEVTDSDILNSGTGPTIVNNIPTSTQAVVDFTNNYWGSVDSTRIAQWIVPGDGLPQGATPAEIQFVPFSTGSVVPTRQQSVSSLKALFERFEAPRPD